MGRTSREENAGKRKAESGVTSQTQRKQGVKIPRNMDFGLEKQLNAVVGDEWAILAGTWKTVMLKVVMSFVAY
ncbi:hypothetical protein STEG23_016906, partial [Scotinomys teguina]